MKERCGVGRVIRNAHRRPGVRAADPTALVVQLVVVNIIAILIGLLIPAVQK